MLAAGILLSLLVIVSCGGQFPATPKGTYAQSLSMFNGSVEAYYTVLKVQDDATKAKWKADINPLIHSAGAALDGWHMVIGTVEEQNKYSMYLRLWQQLLPMMIKVGVLEIKE